MAMAGKSLATLVGLSLATMTVLYNPGCCPPSPTTTFHLTPYTPVSAPTPAETLHSTAHPAPTLLPAVALKEPESGARFDYESTVTLRWTHPHVLQANEFYRLRVWAEDGDPLLFYLKENYFPLADLSPGEYRWAVCVVRSTAQDPYVDLSEGSSRYRFRIGLPRPMVHAVSPTNTLQGVSAAVTVYGEHFTRTMALTIGVPLQATFVNSGTITATVPPSLDAGEYPVVVSSPAGAGISSASFTVMQPPTSVPTPTPYPPPELAGLDILRCNATFKWTWSGTLADDEWFAVRVGRGSDPPHSVAWIKERVFTFTLREPGDYVWEIGICRGDLAEARCEQLAVSEREVFSWRGCTDLP